MVSGIDSDKLLTPLSDIQKKLEYIRTRRISDPGSTEKILSDALKQLLTISKELSTAEEDLRQQNEKLIEAEKAIKKSEERFYRLFEDDLTGDFIATPDGEILVCNPAYVRIFGFSRREDAIATNLSQLYLHPNEYVDFVNLIREQKVLDRYEGNCRRLDGAVIHVVENIVGEFNERGELIQFKGYAFDDTERKRIEEELRQSKDELEQKVLERTEDLSRANLALQVEIAEREQAEEKLLQSKEYLNKIINAISDPIFVKDREHRLVLINEAECSLIGRSREEILSRTDYDFFPKEQVDVFWEKDEEVFKTGKENVNEEQITDAQGNLRTIITKKTLYIDSTGNKFIVGIIRDVTDLKQTEQELKSAKEAAEAATEAKAKFLANMSHEIRTPMNAIIGLTGLLQRTDPNEEQRDYIETIRSSGEALLSVINNILDFSKIDSGKIELEAQPFDLKDCIEDSLDLVATEASKKGLNLSYTIDPSAPGTIMGDPARLRQILINLLNNAVKFTDKGEVMIAVSGRKLEGGEHEIRFAIKDTGIGIPEDRISRLFQPFSQVDASTTRRYGGTGLGLVISKRLVEVMGGRIWAESQVGKGSTFHFTILAAATTLEPVSFRTVSQQTRIDLKSSRPSTLRILLAEDNPVNQKVAQQMLRKIGYEADVAANGLEVLQALERQPYDIILMDVQMPEMDGLEAARKIREKWHNGPTIIAITAYALEGDRDRCLNAGMDDYISKPIQLDELQSKLIEWGTNEHLSHAKGY